MRTVPYFNPDDTTPAVLEAISVGREPLLQEILTSLRNQAEEDRHQHWLLMGPLGTGKSHVMALLHHRVKRGDLDEYYLPLRVPEAEYLRMRGAHGFLESVLKQLGQELDPDALDWLPAALKELRGVRDPAERFNGALALIHDARSELKRKLLVLVENFHRILERVGNKNQQRRVREVLQADDTVLLVATTPLRALDTDSPTHAMYQHFSTRTLEGLSPDQVQSLLQNLGQQQPGSQAAVQRLAGTEGRIKLVHALTGGNPRLVIMLLDAASGSGGIREVYQELKTMLDRQTRYFESRLEQHGLQEQEVLGVFCEADRNLSPKEGADALGREVNQVSTGIGRRCKAGALEPVGAVRRRDNLYAVADDLLRIWYQYRLGQQEGVIQRLVTFLALWYQRDEIQDMLEWSRQQRARADSELERCHAGDLLRHVKAASQYQAKLEDLLPDDAPIGERIQHYQYTIVMLEGKDTPATREYRAQAQLNLGVAFAEVGDYGEALRLFQIVISTLEELNIPEFDRHIASAMSNLGLLYANQGSYENAIQHFASLATSFGEDNRPDIRHKVTTAIFRTGVCEHELNRYARANRDLTKAIRRIDCNIDPKMRKIDALAHFYLGDGMHERGDHLGAIELMTGYLSRRDIIDVHSANENTHELRRVFALMKACLATLHQQQGNHELAIEWYENAINDLGSTKQPRLLENAAVFQSSLVRLLNDSGMKEEALAKCMEGVNHHSGSIDLAATLPVLLLEHNDKEGSRLAWHRLLSLLTSQESQLGIPSEVIRLVGRFILLGIGPTRTCVKQLRDDLAALRALPKRHDLDLSSLGSLDVLVDYCDEFSRPQRGALTPQQRAERVLDRVPKELRGAVEEMVQEVMDRHKKRKEEQSDT